MEWYCILQGSQRGPMSQADLMMMARDGALQPDDYVWNESFGDQWRRLRDVPELTAPPVLATIVPPDAAPEAAVPRAVVVATPVNGAPRPDAPDRRPRFSVAAQQAWDRMMGLLFRCSNPVRWLGMAFCVWVSLLGLLTPNLGIELLKARIQPDQDLTLRMVSATTPDEQLSSMREVLLQMRERFWEFATPNVAITVALVWLALLAITGWFRARGTFMVLHRWYHPDATVGESWAAGSGLAWSLFWFRLGFGALLLAPAVALGMDLQSHVLAPLQGGAAYQGAIATHGFLAALGLSTLLVTWLAANILLNHFVVPVMYWRRVGVVAAGRTVLDFCNACPGRVMFYLAMCVALPLVVSLTCCVCCCARLLLLVPLVNAVLLLPAVIFFRGLGVAFLRQWRPELENEGS